MRERSGAEEQPAIKNEKHCGEPREEAESGIRSENSPLTLTLSPGGGEGTRTGRKGKRETFVVAQSLISFRPQSMNAQSRAVPQTPEYKIPRCPMPQAAQQHRHENVEMS